MGSDVSESASSSNSNIVDALTSKEQRQTSNSSTTFLWDHFISGSLLESDTHSGTTKSHIS